MASYLSLKEEITTEAIAIVVAHKGKAVFDIGETAKICGMDRKFIGPEFDKHGILATKKQNSKYFTAVAIAEYLHAERISPLESCRKRRVTTA